jgi:catechol 2,3-dioxygenase-like lactoylglutathione lyase family enzyme
MSIIKIHDIEYARFAAPDLDVMRDFLVDFGLKDLGPQLDGFLRMRANGTVPVVHVTEPGEAGFLGLALRAASLDDLETLAVHEGVAVEDAPGPGGGKLVRLVDPDGFVVDVVAGGIPARPLPDGANPPWNNASEHPRAGLAKRVATGPSNVRRLGHIVLIVSDLERTWRWWRERFGFIISDDVRAPDGTPAAMFVRCDRGDEPTDHHTLNFSLVPGKSPQFHHVAYEVADLDDLMVGHDNLVDKGYRHAWGIGRHFLGSQVFDYWLDPFGNRIEHWTDGDLFAAGTPTHVTDLDTMLGHQWGPNVPADFV